MRLKREMRSQINFAQYCFTKLSEKAPRVVIFESLTEIHFFPLLIYFVVFFYLRFQIAHSAG